MPLQCNIDSKGKAMRLINGFIVVAISIAVAVFWAWLQSSATGWIVAIALFASGAFMIFEGWAGWCVLRAMGIKTRI